MRNTTAQRVKPPKHPPIRRSLPNVLTRNLMTLCAVRRYKKEEQHEDDQKHHCPTRKATETSAIVHCDRTSSHLRHHTIRTPDRVGNGLAPCATDIWDTCWRRQRMARFDDLKRSVMRVQTRNAKRWSRSRLTTGPSALSNKRAWEAPRTTEMDPFQPIAHILWQKLQTTPTTTNEI